jgi:hypothetical protein
LMLVLILHVWGRAPSPVQASDDLPTWLRDVMPVELCDKIGI